MIAVVPALNEAASIGAVIEGVRATTRIDEVVVVDDGSTDATATVAAAHGATVLELPFNLGVGGAVRLGLRYAVDQQADGVIVLDADGQHEPGDIGALIAALDDGSNMAIGSRFAPGAAGYDMSGTRRSAQRFLNRLVRRAGGFTTTDATSGFRAFDPAVVELLAEQYPVEYLADTVEVILLVRGAGFRVSEVPVSMLPRQGGAPSKRRFALVFNYLRLLVGILGAVVFGRGRHARRPAET